MRTLVDVVQHRSAAELLGDWRAAERDSVAARAAASVAALAVASSAAAEAAAVETEQAASAATEAATGAKLAAEQATRLAGRAAETALLMAVTADGDKARADLAISEADTAETEARDRFHADEKLGFHRDR